MEENTYTVNVDDLLIDGNGDYYDDTLRMTDSKMVSGVDLVSEETMLQENNGNSVALYITIGVCIVIGIVLGIILGRKSALK